MIAIDTNVLLRYLLWDNVRQAKQADALINGTESVLVTDVVLIETVWTLRGRKYNVDKAGIVDVIDGLFGEPNILFEDGQAVWRALQAYRKTRPVKARKDKKEADFADALIVFKADAMAAVSGTELKRLYTFDVAARQLPLTAAP